MTEDAPQRDFPGREVFNGLRWIVRSGSSWRLAPHDLPPWYVVYQQTRAVAKQAHVKPTEARMIHERPAVIQELAWQVPYMRSSPGAESVKDILFNFYNGELFRMVVTYDPDRIAGMTAEDTVEAVSAHYGTATSPVAEIILS
jgi:transposase